MNHRLAEAYKSGAQRARVTTENWGARELFCPACPQPILASTPTGCKAYDFRCPSCALRFQLKSSKRSFGTRVPDGAYLTMLQAIETDETPAWLLLNYDAASWTVQNLLLIPAFGFPKSAIVARRPLSGKARRCGWQGCYLNLKILPPELRISLVTSGKPESIDDVRCRYGRLKGLQDLPPKIRGWTLDVLTVVRSLGKHEFTNADVYAHAGRLEKLHPDNKHVKDKIRQQLQVLRDLGLLKTHERARWILTREA